MIKYLYYVKNIAKRMFSFSGRANRRDFIILQIIYICLNISLILPLCLGFSSFLTFIGLILFISNLAITIRRLHDFNVSGWTYFFLNCFFV